LHKTFALYVVSTVIPNHHPLSKSIVIFKTTDHPEMTIQLAILTMVLTYDTRASIVKEIGAGLA
jgi:hypothetical protein